MECIITKTPEGTLAKVEGRVDTASAPQLLEQFNTIPVEGHLTVDFSDLEYISSAGLRTMLIMRKRFPGDTMVIKGVSESVFNVFKTTGFDRILNLEMKEGPKAEKVREYLQIPFAQILSNNAREKGDKVGFIWDDEPYTWKEIDDCAKVLADDLRKLGAKKGSHIAIDSTNSANWVLSFFAIQKLGAIAILVNFNYKAQELQRLSKIGDIEILCYGDSPVKMDDEFFKMVTDPAESTIRTVYDIRKSVNFKDRIKTDKPSLKDKIFHRNVPVAAIPSDDTFPTVLPDDPCVMIFTSGSSGNPKAVLHSAYNILNSGDITAENLNVEKPDILCLLPPLFHILGLAQMVALMLRGNYFVIPASFKGPYLIPLVAKHKCTHMVVVPTMIIQILKSKLFRPSYFESLKICISAGAAATETQMKDFQALLPNVKFVGLYGMSEMAPITMTGLDDSLETIATTVGKPVHGVELKISDPDTNEALPTGKSGEVLARGFNLMCSYYKLDIDKQPIDESGWIHTGDMGMLDEKGYLHLTGRLKDLIIRGGENISPLEIEEVISQKEGFKELRVIGVRDDYYGEEVCACIVPDKGVKVDSTEIRSYVAGKLAKYKVPKYVLEYTEFPHLASGKIDMVNLKQDAEKKIEVIKAQEAAEKAAGESKA